MSGALAVITVSLLSYLIGCFNAAFFLTKWRSRKDIRDFGSGNAGTTNMLRTFGVKAAIPVFALDALKGCLAVFLAGVISPGNGLCACLAGVMVVSGHNWPVFMGFRGGKGVAATLGVAIAAVPEAAGVGAFVFIASLLTCRMVSASALMGILCAAVSTTVIGKPVHLILMVWILTVMSFVQHIPNIRRIISGSESKWGKPPRGGGKPDEGDAGG